MDAKVMTSERTAWYQQRSRMEKNNLIVSPYGTKIRKRTRLFNFKRAIKFAHHFSKLAYPIYQWGERNAKALTINYIQHDFTHLPVEFDDYKILHLSDFHLDESADIVTSIIQKITKLEYDVCIITGDFFSKKRSARKYWPLLKTLLAVINQTSSCYAVLGNHDSCELVESLEDSGLKLLINESVLITKNNQQILLAGTDDVHYYYTPHALQTFNRANQYFTIALVHSPELVEYAQQQGVDLYLTGHTHGGQICLSNKRPLVTNLHSGHQYYSQRWCYKQMHGYTSHGVGTSHLRVRFNAPAEITIHSLRRLKRE